MLKEPFIQNLTGNFKEEGEKNVQFTKRRKKSESFLSFEREN